MRDNVPSPRYSPVCNVLRQWKTSLSNGVGRGGAHGDRATLCTSDCIRSVPEEKDPAQAEPLLCFRT